MENRRSRSGEEIELGGSLKERAGRFFRGMMGKERMLPVSIGLLLFGLGLFMLYAFVTYLFEGSADQSVLLDPDLADVAAQAEAMQGSSGVVGMHLMHLMVNEWVGLGVIFVIILLLAMGLGLLGPAKVN